MEDNEGSCNKTQSSSTVKSVEREEHLPGRVLTFVGGGSDSGGRPEPTERFRRSRGVRAEERAG